MLLLLALLAGSPVPAESRQLVLSVAPTWNAPRTQVRLYERDSAEASWHAAAEGVNAVLGRSGLGWGRGLHPDKGLPKGPQKQEGDGRSPAGVFLLREATGYAASPPAGTRLPYRQATDALKCVDDPRSTHYNRLLLEDEVAKDWSSAEDLRPKNEQYRLVVWVGHNDDPPVPKGGSCIFLHVWAGPARPTVGCTAFDADTMERILTWLDPAARPVLVQLPSDAYAQLRQAWGLP
jgi:L,D-peptidoglycan transpeptidase YkuD (ErfK/YbiS/YcfS/YnhG family)